MRALGDRVHKPYERSAALELVVELGAVGIGVGGESGIGEVGSGIAVGVV